MLERLKTAAALATLLAAAPTFAQVTRVPNTTLKMPTEPRRVYAVQTAFPGVAFSAPIAFATPPGEMQRLFVVERAGRIKVIPDLDNPSASVFLDIASRVTTSGEEGLLSLAFHPDYASNRFFYVFYSTSVAGQRHQRVSRFTASASNPSRADAASEQVLIEQRDDFSNHQGGDMHFGPDGYLYISVGDEGGGNDSGNNSQRIDKDFFSGILRIDVDKRQGNLPPNPHPAVRAGTYLVPADNPWVGATSFNGLPVDPAKVRTEFWAVGLRNPWRFSFDPVHGTLYCGDVGQSAREEIDIIEGGKNYGWAFREGLIAGPKPKPAGAVATDPILDYRPGEGRAVVGGIVYWGSNLPELTGTYIFGDNTSGNIWALEGPGKTRLVIDGGVAAFGSDPRNGDVLIANIGGNAVKRLVHGAGAGTIPTKLSQTGAFSDLATLAVHPGIVPYAPTVPFWSDFARKTRWFSIPDVTSRIGFAADSNWTLPVGSVWVKHFELELERGNPASRRRLETRFLVKNAAGVYGVTYRWNAEQTDADLVPEGGLDEDITVVEDGTPRTQRWHYPGTAECLSCHTAVAGGALSFNTRQMNNVHVYPDGAANQIQALADAGYFSGPVGDVSSLPVLAPAADTTQSLELRARSFLQANCSQCHQPGGTGGGMWDARIKTPLANAGLINGPLTNTGGDPANRVIVPEDPDHSMLLRRLQDLPDAPRMPPLASNELDQGSIALVRDWVLSIALDRDVVREAEAVPRTSAGANTIVQNDATAGGGQWISLAADGLGDAVDFTLQDVPAGTYAVKLRHKIHPNRGVLRLSVDGVPVGATLDQFSATPQFVEATFGTVTLPTAGTRVLRLAVAGRNPSAGAFTLSADRLSLIWQGPASADH